MADAGVLRMATLDDKSTWALPDTRHVQHSAAAHPADVAAAHARLLASYTGGAAAAGGASTAVAGAGSKAQPAPRVALDAVQDDGYILRVGQGRRVYCGAVADAVADLEGGCCMWCKWRTCVGATLTRHRGTRLQLVAALSCGMEPGPTGFSATSCGWARGVSHHTTRLFCEWNHVGVGRACCAGPSHAPNAAWCKAGVLDGLEGRLPHGGANSMRACVRACVPRTLEASRGSAAPCGCNEPWHGAMPLLPMSTVGSMAAWYRRAIEARSRGRLCHLPVPEVAPCTRVPVAHGEAWRAACWVHRAPSPAHSGTADHLWCAG